MRVLFLVKSLVVAGITHAIDAFGVDATKALTEKDSASPHRAKKLNQPISVSLTKIVIPVDIELSHQPGPAHLTCLRSWGPSGATRQLAPNGAPSPLSAKAK